MRSDRPINMRAMDVRALLAATKTQHRIPITSVRTTARPEKRPSTLRGADLEKALDQAADFHRLDGDLWSWTASAFSYQVGARTNWLAHVGYAPGQRLWVRESITQRPMANIMTGEPTNAIVAAYAADDKDVVEKAGFNLCPWWTTPGVLPSGRMPRMASRLTLEVTGVRVQCLQDISDDDTQAEGAVNGLHDWDCRHPYFPDPAGYCVSGCGSWSYKEVFQRLWDSLHGKKPGEAWQDNPFVIALTFTPYRTNIDAMEKPHAAA